MQIRDCMTRHVELTSPDTTLAEAARMMRDGDFGMLPVGENDRLIGMITDRDIVIRAVADDKDPRSVMVRDAMSSKVLYCFEDQSTEEAARSMGENRVRRLPVLNRGKRLVGIISLGDISQKSGERATGDALKHIPERGNGLDELRAAM